MPFKQKINHDRNDKYGDLAWAPDPIPLKPKRNSAQDDTQSANILDPDDTDDNAPVKRRSSKKKAQPGIYDGKPEAIDFIAPSVVKELLPNDLSDGAIVGEYMLEIGGTSTFKRYHHFV